MNPVAELKAAGKIHGTTLSQLGNASLPSGPREKRLCLHPDRPDRELAEEPLAKLRDAFAGTYDEEACDCIQTMHRRMLEATGRGSWPAGKACHPEHYPHAGYHAALTYIDYESFLRNNSIRREVSDDEWQRVVVDAKVWPSVENPVESIAECKRTFVYGGPAVAAHDRPEWAERSDRKNGDVFTLFDMSTWMTLEATRRAGCLYLEVFTGDSGKHNVHELMKAIPGETAGFAYFNNGTCGDHVTSNIDSLNTGYDLGWLTGLRTHEFGHTLNLQHEFRGPQSGHRSVMSYATDNTPFQGYRLNQDPYWVNQPGNRVEDHSWPELRQLFGGEAAKPVGGVVAPPTVAPDIPGILTGEVLPDGTYIVEGEVGPIPDGAEGHSYIMKRIGNSRRHQLIPKAEV